MMDIHHIVLVVDLVLVLHLVDDSHLDEVEGDEDEVDDKKKESH
jgi:hypothetical protein